MVFAESVVEDAILAFPEGTGWPARRPADPAPREAHGQGVLAQRLRDTLVIKLISGELWAKDVERFVGGVGNMDEVDSGRA